MRNFINQNRLAIIIILSGILFRLIFAFFFTHIFDYRNILAIVRSVAQTGNVTAGFFDLKRSGLEIQLYGKLYYQIAALWMQVLQIFGLIDIPNFTYLNVPLYQLVSIKLIQFLYDFIFLFFLYKIADILKINKIAILLLWAFNPYPVFVAYAMFQADIAMLSALTAGVYFILLSIQSRNKTILYPVIAIVLFAIGAILKQVPLLLIPFVLIIFSNNLRDFLIMAIAGAVSYSLLGQPWAADSQLIKLFFLISKESTAIFNFQLNGIPLFLILYFSLLLLVMVRRQLIRSNPLLFVMLTTLLLATVYISEDNSYFFPQFNVWIMPFIILLALARPAYSIFFITPVIGFFKRQMIDNDFLTGALSESFGSQLANLLRYDHILRSTVNTTLIDYALNSLLFYMYIFLSLCLLNEFNVFTKGQIILEKLTQPIKKYAVSFILGMCALYFVLLGIDYAIKSQYISYRVGVYQETGKEYKIHLRPLSVYISNPGGGDIKAIVLRSVRNGISSYDKVNLHFFDETQNKILFKQQVLDYLFPEHPDELFIPLNKTINAKKIRLDISKENSLNDISFYQAKKALDPPDITKTRVKRSDILSLKFSETPILLDIRGQYPFIYIAYSLGKHFLLKPAFYIVYAAVNLLLAITIIALFRYKPRQSLAESIKEKLN